MWCKVGGDVGGELPVTKFSALVIPMLPARPATLKRRNASVHKAHICLTDVCSAWQSGFAELLLMASTTLALYNTTRFVDLLSSPVVSHTCGQRANWPSSSNERQLLDASSSGSNSHRFVSFCLASFSSLSALLTRLLTKQRKDQLTSYPQHSPNHSRGYDGFEICTCGEETDFGKHLR
ncbi:unnamed protein product [Soboliphyme baturini]|uniref:Secreted protein n=1 Tax=Soboliphyme baturini TaxID=241478 RepID=A0A183INL9_9BILA|nr:unnamed protein product [Soboliphyme baturini]